jgi:hypothetical protein
MNAAQVTRFFKEHLLGLCLLAIVMGLITNLIYDAAKDRKETSRVDPATEEKEKAEAKMAEARRLLANKQAIQNHLRKFGVEAKKIEGIKPNSTIEARRLLHSFYDAALKIPTYECPEDYRKAYQKVLEHTEKVVNFLDAVPTTVFEWSFEAIKDGQALNPGDSDRTRQETLNAILRQFQASLQELDAVAFRYGVR